MSWNKDVFEGVVLIEGLQNQYILKTTNWPITSQRMVPPTEYPPRAPILAAQMISVKFLFE